MNILENGQKELYQISECVEHGTNIKELVGDMWKTLHKTSGVGLAANQVGILKRIILVKDNGFVSEIINPVITRSSKKHKNSDEGCLSVPGKKVTVKRESWVVVEGYDIDWNPIRKKCRGLLANIIQHEIDHLNGKLIGE